MIWSFKLGKQAKPTNKAKFSYKRSKFRQLTTYVPHHKGMNIIYCMLKLMK